MKIQRNDQASMQKLGTGGQKKTKQEEGVDIPKDQVSIGGDKGGEELILMPPAEKNIVPGKEKEITFLTYLDGSNNLENMIMQNLKDMERIGSNDNMNIVAQLSRFQVPPLTKNFFGEALKQVVGNEKFGEVLSQATGNPEGVKEFQESFKNPQFASYMAESVLSSTPPLMQGMTEMVENMAGQVLGDKDMGQMFASVAFQLAQQMVDVKGDKVENAAMSMTKSQGKEIDRLSKYMLNGLSKFINENMKEGKVLYVDSPYTGGKVMKSADKAFVPDNEPGWIGARRYHVTKGDDESVINSKVLEDMEFVNMGEPKTLTDFIVWGMKNFPAKKYVILASDHGAGILGGFEDRGKMMTLPQVNEGLLEAEKQTGIKPEVLIFDACLMAQTEVAYELKDRAKVMVASEETVGGMGMPYVPMLKGMNELAEKGAASGENIARMMIDECAKTSEKSTTTFSAIDLSKMDKVKENLDKLALELVSLPEENVKFLIHNTTAYSQSSPARPYRDFRDLGHLVDNIVKFKDMTNESTIKAAQEVKKALSEAVIAEEHIQKQENYEKSQGLTIYAPKNDAYMSDGIYKEYKDTAMSKDGLWDDFVDSLTKFKPKEKGEGDKVGKPEFRPLPQRH